MTQAERCIEHIEKALDELHRIKWTGHQTELNLAWDDLVNAKDRVEAINRGKENTKDNRVSS